MRLVWIALALTLLLPVASAQNMTEDNATASLVLDRFDNPLPAPLDNETGVFLLNLCFWVAIGIAAAVLLNPVVKTLTRATKSNLDDSVVRIITKPTFVLIVVYGAKQSLQSLRIPNWSVQVLDGVWSIVWIMTLTVVIFRVWKEVIRGVARKVTQQTESDLDDKLFPLFDKLSGVIILFAGIWFAVGSLGVNMTLFAAGGAVGGLVLAFAAQDTLGNLFAGVFILIDRPFREGDRIEIQEINTWGDVQEIGLRTTRIRTRDNRMVIVPNSVIGGNPVVNHSYPDPVYRIGVDVGVAYGTPIEEARAVMLAAIESVDDVMMDKRREALFRGFGDSSLNFHVRAFFPHYLDARRYEDKINTALERGLRDAGIEIPFPQRVVHLQNH